VMGSYTRCNTELGLQTLSQ